MRQPRGGKGSNQYVTRGSPAPTRENRGLRDVLGYDPDAEVTAVAFSAQGLGVWHSWSATNHEIADWHAAGFSGSSAVLWLCHDETITPTEARLITADAPAMYWNRWAASGIPPAEVGGWMQTLDQRDVIDPQIAVLWRDAGYSSEDAAALMDLYPTPADFAYWEAAAQPGQNAEQALVKRFTDAGVDPIYEDWSEGLTPCALAEGEMEDWLHTWGIRMLGITDPEDIRKWRAAAFPLATDQGIPIFATAAAAAHQLSAEPEWACQASIQVERLDRRAGLVGGKTIARLHETDPVNPEQAALVLSREWRERIPSRKKDIMDRDEWTDWIEAGLSSREAQRWRDAGVNSPRAASFWRGHDPGQIAPWYDQTLPTGPRPNPYAWGYALTDLVRRRGGTPEQAGRLLEQVALSGLPRG